MLYACGRVGLGVTSELHILSASSSASTHIFRWYAAAASGASPRSTLRDDVGLELILGRHQDAAEQYAEAVRDAVRERLSAGLSTRRRQTLDFATLNQLPTSDLADACRIGRLPQSSDPTAMAAALCALLHPSSLDGAPPLQPQQPLQQQSLPLPLRRASWQGLGSGTGLAAADPAAQRPPPPAGLSAAGVAGPDAYGVDAVEEAQAEAAWRAEAERAADALFDEELQRRLQNAATGANPGGPPSAAVTVPASPAPGLAAPGSIREATEPSAAAADEASAMLPGGGAGLERAGRWPSAGSQGDGPDGRHAALSAAASGQQAPGIFEVTAQSPDAAAHRGAPSERAESLAAAGTAPEPAPRGPLFTGMLRTTELLVASQQGAGGRSSGQEGGGIAGAATGAAVAPGNGAPASPYDPVALNPQPTEVLRALRRRLSRMGYGTKDPGQLRSLLLLSRRDLQELVRDFCGDTDPHRLADPDPLDLGTAGGPGLLSRQQLAIRLLQLLGPHAAPPETQHPPPQGMVSSQSQHQQLQPEGQRAERQVIAPDVQESAARPLYVIREDSSQALAEPEPAVAADGVALVSGAAQAGHGDLGDPRRREVLAAAARRRELMAAAARPEEVTSWLVKARAQDVLLIHLGSDQDPSDIHSRRDHSFRTGTDVGASAAYPYASGPESAPGSGPGSGSGSEASVVIATGLSQRHVYACAEAVRYQIRERIEELAADGPGGPLPRHWVPGPPAVSGANGGDWVSLEAGSVQVHVLTPQARQYYRLEEIFAAPYEQDPYGSRFGRSDRMGSAGRRARVRLFGPAGGEMQPDTLETARVAEHDLPERL